MTMAVAVSITAALVLRGRTADDRTKNDSERRAAQGDGWLSGCLLFGIEQLGLVCTLIDCFGLAGFF